MANEVVIAAAQIKLFNLCLTILMSPVLKHGDISRTIFLRCNGAREYSENISTAKFFYVYGTHT